MPKATRQSHPFPPLQLWSYSLSSPQSLLKELCMAPFCAESSLFRNSSGLSPLIFLGEGLADNIHGHFLWLYLPHWTAAAFSKPGHFLLPGLLLPLASIHGVSISHSLSNPLTCSSSCMAKFTSGLTIDLCLYPALKFNYTLFLGNIILTHLFTIFIMLVTISSSIP